MNNESNNFKELPNIEQLLIQRIAQKKMENNNILSQNTIDPYKIMLDKFKLQRNCNNQENNLPIQQWPEEDIKELEEYCKKMGIIGFSTKLNPKIALMKLKQQFQNYEGIPLEDRIPDGYEKIIIKNEYNSCSQENNLIKKKQIIHG